MKESNAKNMEQFVAKAIKETILESPSNDFTRKIMNDVWAMEKSKATVYKPLISKTGWVMIFAGIIATMVYLFRFGKQDAGKATSLGKGARSFLSGLNEARLFQFSQITINVILISMTLILIEITLLKNLLDKRWEK